MVRFYGRSVDPAIDADDDACAETVPLSDGDADVDGYDEDNDCPTCGGSGGVETYKCIGCGGSGVKQRT